jgi:hypothetical protein
MLQDYYLDNAGHEAYIVRSEQEDHAVNTKILSLTEIKSLRPAGTTVADYREAIAKVEDAREAALDVASQSEAFARSSLLTATDKEITDAEARAASAKLSADRLSALVAELGTALDSAEIAEAGADGARLAAAALAADSAYVASYKRHMVLAAETAAKVITALREADAAIAAAHGHVGALPRHDLPRPLFGRVDAGAVIALLATFAPSEIKRAEDAAAVRAAACEAKEQAERADREARAAEYALAQRAEREAEARAQAARAMPSDNRRVPVSISGNGGW